MTPSDGTSGRLQPAPGLTACATWSLCCENRAITEQERLVVMCPETC